MHRVRVLEQAAEEAIEAAAWYDQQRGGLGTEFAQAIDAAIALLADEIVPLATMPGAVGARGAKRLVLKRFPFDIVVQERDDEILIVAVAQFEMSGGRIVRTK